MKTILNHSNDPYFNLAFEEYVFKHVKSEEDILLLWVNLPAVIVGRNQVIFGEVNVAYCETYDMPIIRRISGGGTVYHDLGNLNYSVITSNYKDVLSNYPYFTKKVIEYLKSLGVEVAFSGKSDIVIGKEKISGNAQLYHQNRLLHHGTILFNSDLNKLNQVIKQKTSEINTPGIDSNRTNVTNVSTHLKKPLTIDIFKADLLKFWLEKTEIESEIIHLSQDDYQAIETLKNDKYMNWSWNFGESPNFEIKKTHQNTHIHIQVVSGLIEQFKLTREKTEINLNLFKGIKYEKNAFIQQIEFENHEHKDLLQSIVPILFI